MLKNTYNMTITTGTIIINAIMPKPTPNAFTPSLFSKGLPQFGQLPLKLIIFVPQLEQVKVVLLEFSLKVGLTSFPHLSQNLEFSFFNSEPHLSQNFDKKITY